MIRLNAASIVSVMLLGTAQIKKSEVRRIKGKRIPVGIMRCFSTFFVSILFYLKYISDFFEVYSQQFLGDGGEAFLFAREMENIVAVRQRLARFQERGGRAAF